MTLPAYVETHRADANRAVFWLLTVSWPTVVRLTDFDRPIVSGGNTFTPSGLEVGGVSETIASPGAPSIGGFSIASGAGNVWQAVVAGLTDSQRNAAVVFEEAWLDPATLSGIPQAVRTVFSGQIESAEWTAKGVRFTVAPAADPTLARFPRREEGTLCGYPEFKGPECAYAGAETACDRTFARCSALGNQARFGGFRYLPVAGTVARFTTYSDGVNVVVEEIVFQPREEE